MLYARGQRAPIIRPLWRNFPLSEAINLMEMGGQSASPSTPRTWTRFISGIVPPVEKKCHSNPRNWDGFEAAFCPMIEPGPLPITSSTTRAFSAGRCRPAPRRDLDLTPQTAEQNWVSGPTG